jgi:ketosteroid isomerase-like protein
MLNKILIVLCLIFFSANATHAQKVKKAKATAHKVEAQSTVQTDIYKAIFKADSVFFQAFNTCDSVAYRTFLTDDLEFYHDLGGQHFLPTEMQSLREMCAMNSHIRRELMKNTLEVIKLGNFGALEIGVHRIYHTNPGQSEHISGDYKFVHVWENKDGVWKLKRIISYGHGKMNND